MADSAPARVHEEGIDAPAARSSDTATSAATPSGWWHARRCRRHRAWSRLASSAPTRARGIPSAARAATRNGVRDRWCSCGRRKLGIIASARRLLRPHDAEGGLGLLVVVDVDRRGSSGGSTPDRSACARPIASRPDCSGSQLHHAVPT
jgi:hypothetical protein